MLRLADPPLFFIHIPKCGGTTVSQSLRPLMSFPVEEMAADLGRAEQTQPPRDYRHPVLGPIKVNHIPMPVLAEHFPRVWDALRAATSFVVVRDPRDRFASAVLQRLREYKGAGASSVSDAAIQDEAKRVRDWLDGRDAFADADYIHFARQIDYVEYRGEVVHDRVFAIERLGELYKWLHEAQGLPLIQPEAKRIGRRPRGWLRHVHPVASRTARLLLNERAREAIYPLWLRSGAFVKTSEGYGKIAFDSEVEAFVAEYYAGDRALHRAALDHAEPEAAWETGRAASSAL